MQWNVLQYDLITQRFAIRSIHEAHDVSAESGARASDHEARGRAIETFACRAGPGILHKLRAVMADLLKRRQTGDVTMAGRGPVVVPRLLEDATAFIDPRRPPGRSQSGTVDPGAKDCCDVVGVVQVVLRDDTGQKSLEIVPRALGSSHGCFE